MVNIAELGQELSSRELDVLKLIFFESEEIEKRLHISKNTIKQHLQNIRYKLGTDKRHKMVLMVLKEQKLKVEDFIIE